MKPVLHADFWFPLSALSAPEVAAVVDDLDFKSMGGEKYGFGQAATVSLTKTEDRLGVTWMGVPRRYAYERLPQLCADADDQTIDGTPVKMTFNDAFQAQRPELKLRQDQLINEYLSAIEAQVTPFKGGIACAPCGTGKTVMLLKMLTKLGRTALVLVHKDFLVEQWKERMAQFTNLKPEEIGHVQRDTCDYQDKKVVVAMVQSITQREYPKAFYNWPGVVVCDETHRMGAPVFNQAIPLFPARYRIGLTATPRRGDGLQPVFEWHIGKVAAKMVGAETTPKVYQIPFDVYLPESVYKFRDKVFLGKLVTRLSKLQGRTTWIAKECVRACKADRRVMVLSDRIEHLENLKAIFDLECHSAYTSGFYIGGMKEAERKTSAQCDLILGTFAMAQEGLDIPEIDTLFLATPHSDVEQPIGRILRWHEDKKEPVIVDIVDSVPVCQKFAEKRLKQYRRLKYDVRKEASS